jgi:phage gpG-like protein
LQSRSIKETNQIAGKNQQKARSN